MTQLPSRLVLGTRRKLVLRGLILAFGLLLLGSWAPDAVGAASAEDACGLHFGDLTLAEGQTLACDLNVLGGSALVETGARLEGSLNVMTGSARILGEVTQDVVAARDLAVSGRVGGNAFAIGGDAEVSGEIEGKLTTARGDVRLAGGARVGGSVSSRGSVRLAAESAVEGDVIAGERIDMDPGASVGGRQLEQEVSSGYSAMQGARASDAGWLKATLLGAFLLLAMLFGALTQLALPTQVGRIATAASSSPATMILLGLIALLVTPFSWILLVTIPLTPIVMALGWVGLGLAWGRNVAPRRGATWQAAAGALLLATLTILLMTLMGAFPEYLSLYCGLAFLLCLPAAWAYGASLMTLLGTRAVDRKIRQPEEEPGVPVPLSPTGDRPGGETSPTGAIPSPSPSNPGAETPARMPLPALPQAAMPAGDLPGGAELDASPDAEARTDLGAVPDVPVAVPSGDPGAVTSPPAAELASPAEGLDPAPEAPHDEALHGPPLRQVLGLSPIYAELLRGAGILGAKDLAALSPDEVARLTQAPGVMAVGADKAAAWIRAARSLLAGSQ